ncbi:hypothetical protein [Paenibacillus sinopodophylli]|uniref:hypothetical protein n=1 Tax=Paenibacillus sinopodophylli TaxID=1837342 RepID=UPI00110CFD10|nr:hypothetical protein [Paenibacillus sinopodophylli]
MSYKTMTEEVMEGNYDRPLGVKIIAILMIVSGTILLITQSIAVIMLNERSVLHGVSSLIFQSVFGFLGLLGLAGGVGMLIGKKWGWWLAVFHFAYYLTLHLNMLVSIPGITEQHAVSGNGTRHYFKNGIQVLWNVLLLRYMCRDYTMSFFKMSDTNTLKAIGGVFCIVAVIFAIGSLLSFL